MLIIIAVITFLFLCGLRIANEYEQVARMKRSEILDNRGRIYPGFRKLHPGYLLSFDLSKSGYVQWI